MYGTGTRSHNRSPERRQMKQECAEATAKYEADFAAGLRPVVVIRDFMCTCRSFQFAHNPKRHRELLSDRDWSTYQERCNRQIFDEGIR